MEPRGCGRTQGRGTFDPPWPDPALLRGADTALPRPAARTGCKPRDPGAYAAPPPQRVSTQAQPSSRRPLRPEDHSFQAGLRGKGAEGEAERGGRTLAGWAPGLSPARAPAVASSARGPGLLPVGPPRRELSCPPEGLRQGWHPAAPRLRVWLVITALGALLLFQRTQVRLPARTWRLTTACNSRGPSSPFWPPRSPPRTSLALDPPLAGPAP
nr:uncharacterized protein LOC121825038 [Peromyscus maniculatus bairdii]